MSNVSSGGPFVHPVPENELGYFAFHSADNVPLSPETHQRIIDGPLTAMQDKLSAELDGENDPRPRWFYKMLDWFESWFSKD